MTLQDIGQLEVLALFARVHALLAFRQVRQIVLAAKGGNIFSITPAMINVRAPTIIS